MWVDVVVAAAAATTATTSNIAPYRGIDSNHSCFTDPPLKENKVSLLEYGCCST